MTDFKQEFTMKKNRIGIVSLYYKNDNYGGIAQSYALYKALEKLGYPSELISYDRKIVAPKQKKVSFFEKIKRNSISGICNRYYRKAKEKLEKELEKPYAEGLKKRSLLLEQFREKIPHSKVYTKETIFECEDNYTTFISGSDQIWKPGVADDVFLLNFLKHPERKNIFSYASSVAVEHFNEEYLEFMKTSLKKYQSISVRESVTARQFSEYFSYPVSAVVDPTLLLKKEDWKQVTAKLLIEEPYIFCYLLGNDRRQRKKVKAIARKQKKMLVTIPHIKNGNRFAFRLEDWKFGDCQLFEVGMEEFFSLIRYADLVLTDSFHATVFSYLFETDFWVMERVAKDKSQKMNSRIYELTRMLGLEHRILQGNSQISEKIDFKAAQKKIEPYIQKSMEFLFHALEGNICKGNDRKN